MQMIMCEDEMRRAGLACQEIETTAALARNP